MKKIQWKDVSPPAPLTTDQAEEVLNAILSFSCFMEDYHKAVKHKKRFDKHIENLGMTAFMAGQMRKRKK